MWVRGLAFVQFHCSALGKEREREREKETGHSTGTSLDAKLSPIWCQGSTLGQTHDKTGASPSEITLWLTFIFFLPPPLLPSSLFSLPTFQFFALPGNCPSLPPYISSLSMSLSLGSLSPPYTKPLEVLRSFSLCSHQRPPHKVQV